MGYLLVGFDTPVGRNHQAGTSTLLVSISVDSAWEQKKIEASLRKRNKGVHVAKHRSSSLLDLERSEWAKGAG